MELHEVLGGLRLGDDERLVVGPPAGEGWVGMADAIEDPAWLADRLAATLTHADGHARVAASYQASWLAHALVVPAARAVVHLGWTWSLDPRHLWLHPADGGWYDGLSAAGGTRRTTVTGAPADRFARDIVTLMAPLYESINTRAGIGRPLLWGALADAIVGGCVEQAVARGTDQVGAFERASELVERIARLVRMPRVRPALITVRSGDPGQHELRRGTCCLWYRTQVAPDPRGEGFCEGCPRRDLDDQRRRWQAMALEPAAAGS